MWDHPTHKCVVFFFPKTHCKLLITSCISSWHVSSPFILPIPQPTAIIKRKSKWGKTQPGSEFFPINIENILLLSRQVFLLLLLLLQYSKTPKPHTNKPYLLLCKKKKPCLPQRPLLPLSPSFLSLPRLSLSSPPNPLRFLSPLLLSPSLLSSSTPLM